MRTALLLAHKFWEPFLLPSTPSEGRASAVSFHVKLCIPPCENNALVEQQ